MAGTQPEFLFTRNSHWLRYSRKRICPTQNNYISKHTIYKREPYPAGNQVNAVMYVFLNSSHSNAQ